MTRSHPAFQACIMRHSNLGFRPGALWRRAKHFGRRTGPARALLAAAALAGCSTVGSRIRKKSAEFAALDPATQASLRRGEVAIGERPDLVYIALGAPDERLVRTTAKAPETVWIYRRDYQALTGSALAGYRREPVVDPQTNRTVAVIAAPAFVPVYEDRSEDRIRITFRDGKVVEIDRPKD